MKPTVAPGPAPPWWIEDALAREGGRVDAPSLQGDLEVDVAIVGGGYTGLWTALAVLARDPAARVAVLEAEYCGAGPSGRNGGFIEGYWPAVGELRELFGEEAAVRLATAGEGIRPAVQALGEDVWLREAGMLMVATTERQEATVEHAVATAACARAARAGRAALTRRRWPNAAPRRGSGAACSSPTRAPCTRACSCGRCAGAHSTAASRCTRGAV